MLIRHKEIDRVERSNEEIIVAGIPQDIIEHCCWYNTGYHLAVYG